MKSCAKCKLEKPTEEFRLVKKKDKHYRHSYCFICERENAKKYNSPNKWKNWFNSLSPEQQKETRLKKAKQAQKRKYGITHERLIELLEAQYGGCAACMEPLTLDPNQDVPMRNRAAVDHDHETGQIRGLLCGPCNRALGLVKDEQRILKGLLRYLEDYK